MTIGDRIKERRIAAELTQTELAKRIGVSRAAVSQWELNTSKDLKSENLLKCAKILGTNVHYLVTGEGDPERGVDVTDLAYAVTGGSSVAPQDGLDFHSVDFALQSLAMVKDYPAYKEKSKDTDWLARAFIALYTANSDDILREAGPAVILKLVS